MAKKARRPFLQRLSIVLVCLLGLAGLWRVVGPPVRRWQVERAIAHFERSPSQARADDLVGMLQGHVATSEQGSRILTLLRRPTVTTRPTYPAGLPVGVVLEQPYHLAFRDTLWRREEIGIVEGQDRRETSGNGKVMPRTLYFRGLMAYQAKPGTHQLKVRGTYSLGLQRRGRLTSAGYWMGELLGMIGLSLGESWRPARQYECEFEIPFEVTVVPQEEAETIELVSSAQLDATMTKAFRVRSSGHSIPYRTASGEVRHEHLKAVFYRSLPMTVAFRLQLRLSKGSEDGAPFECTRSIRAQAGSSGKLVLNPWEFSIKEPGVYSGTVVLISDPNIAYADPAIKAIWGETLELPISFTIHPELNCPQRSGVSG